MISAKIKHTRQLNYLKKKKNRILLFKNKKNLGYGGSFKKGLSKSNKNYVIVATGDGETNIENMLKYYYLTKKFDIVCTYPVGNDRGFIRNFLSSSFTKILNFFFNLNLKYYNGATYYKKDNLNKILIDSDGFFFNAEILIKLIRKKLKFIQKPIKMKKRNKGTSNAIKINVFINVLFDFIKTRISI